MAKNKNYRFKVPGIFMDLKSGFKTQIRIADKAPADEKAQHTKVCELFVEDGNTVIDSEVIF